MTVISHSSLFILYFSWTFVDVTRDGERKSMSTERTFHEISDPDELYRKCQELSDSLAEDLATEGIVVSGNLPVL